MGVLWDEMFYKIQLYKDLQQIVSFPDLKDTEITDFLCLSIRQCNFCQSCPYIK